MELYHGTSTYFGKLNKILPSSRTGNLREDFRDKLNDCIFLTSSLVSAYKYACKCCEKFGGSPVVYICFPFQIISQHDTEFICDFAVVKGIVDENVFIKNL